MEARTTILYTAFYNYFAIKGPGRLSAKELEEFLWKNKIHDAKQADIALRNTSNNFGTSAPRRLRTTVTWILPWQTKVRPRSLDQRVVFDLSSNPEESMAVSESSPSQAPILAAVEALGLPFSLHAVRHPEMVFTISTTEHVDVHAFAQSKQEMSRSDQYGQILAEYVLKQLEPSPTKEIDAVVAAIESESR